MTEPTPPSQDAFETGMPMQDKVVDKMELHCRQQLSAMLDGALSPDEARFLLRRLQHDQELAACWERWQLCGDLMRGHAHALLPADFAQRVSSALASEGADASRQADTVASGPRWARWARWAGGAALAASVAATALFVTQRNPALDAPGQAPEQQVATAASPLSASPATATASAPAQAVEPLPAATVPGPAEAAALTATAVAAVQQAPRRAVRRARVAPDREQALASGQVAESREETMPRAVASRDETTPPPEAARVSVAAAGQDPFAVDAVTTPRPWPRAVLPGAYNGGINVDYGMQADGGLLRFEHFEPRLPAEPAPQP